MSHKIRDFEERVLRTLAFYVILFCVAFSIPTICLAYLTGEAIYYRWTIGVIVVAALVSLAIMIKTIMEYFEQ
jgi:uncharacterized membrane protein YhaH (DUF805 family)